MSKGTLARVSRAVRRWSYRLRGVPLVLACAMLAAACTNGPPETVAELRISHTLDAEVDVVLDAIEQWRDATDGAVQLTPVMRDDRDADAAWSIRAETLDGQAGLQFRGQVAVDVERIRIVASDQGLDARELLLTTVLHELGHALSLPHEDVGLMRESVAAAYADGVRGCIDEFTVRTLCGRGVGCGPAAHATCR